MTPAYLDLPLLLLGCIDDETVMEPNESETADFSGGLGDEI